MRIAHITALLLLALIVLASLIVIERLSARSHVAPQNPSIYGNCQFIADDVYQVSPKGSSIFLEKTATVNLSVGISQEDILQIQSLGLDADTNLYRMTLDPHPILRMAALWCLFARHGESSVLIAINMVSDEHQCVRSAALKIIYWAYPDSPIKFYYSGRSSEITRDDSFRAKRIMYEWISRSNSIEWELQLPHGKGNSVDIALVYELAE